MKHGNLLGRMATLNKHMTGWYEGYNNATIKKELKELTHIWKPFDPAEDKKYTKYRYSSKELYADAVSVLFNNPTMLQEIAPEFYAGFFEFLERKPNAKTAYRAVQAKINKGYREIQEDRLRNRRAAFERGEQKKVDLARGDEIQSVKDHLKDWLYRKLIDTNASIIFKRNEIRKRGISVDPVDDPVYWIEELPYVSSQVFQYLRDVTAQVKSILDKTNLTEADIGDYLFLNRAATERAALANPWGYTPAEAEAGLDFLRNKMGAEQFALLEDAVEKFREIRREKITSVMEESEMYSDDLMEIINDNENYATFEVQHYMDNKYGGTASGWIYKQIGTLADITNPFTATIMKDAAILRAANRKMAAEATVNFMRQYFPQEIKEADRRWVNNRMEYIDSKDPKQGTIAYLVKGKVKAFYVDKHIADSFAADPYEAGLVVKVWNALYGGLKNIFVSKNPFWAFWNIQRDLRGAALKLPKANLLKMIGYAVKSLPDAAKDVFLGNSTPIVRDLYESKSLLVGRYYSAKVGTHESEFERMLETYTLNPKKYRNVVHRLWSGLMDVLELPGRFSERLFKIAGAKYLLKMGVPRKEALSMVRSRAGSPDFYRRGQWTRGLNNVFMFSNAGKEGWRSSVESFGDGKASFAWKMTKYSILPKLAMMGGSLGLLGTMLGHDDDELKEMFGNIPDHDMQNYQCVPLWLTADNKTVYLIFPDDFTGQVFAGLLWAAGMTDRDAFLTELFDFASGEIPYSSLNPLIQVMFDTIAFFSGKNIYDEWRGELAIRKMDFDAGGKYKAERFLKYEAQKLGVGNYYRFPYNDIERNMSELEEMINKPVLGGFLRRFIRVSDRGRSERLYRAADLPRQERARSNIEMSDKIIQHLNKTSTPSRSDARKLYVSLKKEGMDVGEHFGDRFWPKYMTTALFKGQDSVIRAFNSANTNDAKRAVLEQAFPDIKVDGKFVRRFKRDLKKIFR
jgi:hypothetical protein